VTGPAEIAMVACALLLARVWVLRRRLEAVARAEHELRAPATALSLAAAGWRRDPRHRAQAEALQVQLDRLGAGLCDLADARRGRRSERTAEPVDVGRFLGAFLTPWREGARAAAPPVPALPVRADRGRLAQAIGNLVQNAAEHGHGPLEVHARPLPTGVRLELRNPRGPERHGGPGRGQGLGIASDAAREMGGRLDVRVEEGAVVAALDLPREPPPAA
jgi:signal transduction histidine kinase